MFRKRLRNYGRPRMKVRGIYRFEQSFDRSGTLYGIFVEETSIVDRLYGKEVHFGEILGKHSQVSATITKENLKLITTRYDFISGFMELKLDTGINPLDFIESGELEDSENGRCGVCGK